MIINSYREIYDAVFNKEESAEYYKKSHWIDITDIHWVSYVEEDKIKKEVDRDPPTKKIERVWFFFKREVEEEGLRTFEFCPYYYFKVDFYRKTFFYLRFPTKEEAEQERTRLIEALEAMHTPQIIMESYE